MFSLLSLPSFWESTTSSAIGNAVGVFIALTGTYLIYIKTNKDQKAQDQKKAKQEQRNKLKYFTVLLESALDTSQRIECYLKDFTNELIKNNVSFPDYIVIQLDDLRRISQSLDEEKYMVAYVDEYEEENPDSVIAFKTIKSHTDYLYFELNRVLEIIRTCCEGDNKRKEQLFEKLLEARKGFYKILDNPFRYSEGVIKEVLRLFAIPADRKNSNPSNLHNKFFIPLNNWSRRLWADDNVKQPEYLLLCMLSQEAKEIFLEIKDMNNELVKALTHSIEQIHNSNEFLQAELAFLKL